jgi:hypothetical protein
VKPSFLLLYVRQATEVFFGLVVFFELAAAPAGKRSAASTMANIKRCIKIGLCLLSSWLPDESHYAMSDGHHPTILNI